MIVKIKKVSDDVILPQYQTDGSSGLDLHAYIKNDIKLLPFERVLVPTGIFIEIPERYEAQIRPRSGLALKHGVTLLNTPGTIDSDYRGEIKVILANLSNEPFIIKPGMRIAQIVFAKVEKIKWQLASKVEETDRNHGGFGHTGV